MTRHVTARTLHDLGLAAWFGGSLMGAVGLNAAAASVRAPDERSAAATVGWNRWAPVSALAIGAHLVGGAQLLRTERHRVRRQEGVGRSSMIKAALTAGAVGVTAYSGVLNRRMAAAGRVPVEGATEPGPATGPDVAAAQRQLRVAQWAIPGLTAGLVGVTAWQGEQMRPGQVLSGLVRPRAVGRTPLTPLLGAAAGLALLAGLRRRRSAARLPDDELQIAVVEDVTVYPVDGSSGLPDGTSTRPAGGWPTGSQD